MRNNALFRLLTVLLIALGLGLFLGGSFSPAMEVIASGSTSSINGVEIFLRLFSNTFYLLFVIILMVAGLFVGLYFENKTATVLGGGVAMASSLGLLYVLIAFEVENRKSFKASAPAGATFRVDAPYFLMMIGVVIFLLLSILAIVLALLPEEKKEAEKAA